MTLEINRNEKLGIGEKIYVGIVGILAWIFIAPLLYLNKSFKR